jgi:hypothetical protein
LTYPVGAGSADVVWAGARTLIASASTHTVPETSAHRLRRDLGFR